MLFIFSCLVFAFLYEKINNNIKATQSMQETWQTEATNRDKAISLSNLIKTIEPERTVLDTHFVQSSDVVPFLNTIEKLAVGVGVKAEVTSVNVTAEDNSSLEIEMKVSGSFESIYKLIMLLENSQYDLQFVSANIQHSDTNDEDISVTTKNAKNQIPQWTANFKMKLLSFVNQ